MDVNSESAQLVICCKFLGEIGVTLSLGKFDLGTLNKLIYKKW